MDIASLIGLVGTLGMIAGAIRPAELYTKTSCAVFLQIKHAGNLSQITCRGA